MHFLPKPHFMPIRDFTIAIKLWSHTNGSSYRPHLSIKPNFIKTRATRAFDTSINVLNWLSYLSNLPFLQFGVAENAAFALPTNVFFKTQFQEVWSTWLVHVCIRLNTFSVKIVFLADQSSHEPHLFFRHNFYTDWSSIFVSDRISYLFNPISWRLELLSALSSL